MRALDEGAQETAVQVVGRVGEFTVATELAGIELTTAWATQLAPLLEQAQGENGIESALDRWAGEVISADDSFAGLIYRAGLHASMAGQLMVRAIELEEEAEDGAAGTVLLARHFVRADATAFLGMPFEEAVAFFQDKQVMEPEAFDELAGRFRESGFTARALAGEALRERAHGAILHMLNEGSTLQETIAAIRFHELSLGITPASRDALDTIVRTNVATAYGHGRHQAMNDPDVRSLRPYMMYVTAQDSRVRPSHQVLDGKVFETGTELADLMTTPLGFRCRCSNRTLSQRQLEQRGLTVTTERPIVGLVNGIEVEGLPDRGWEGPPMPLAA